MSYTQTPIKFDIYKDGALLRSEICVGSKIRVGRAASSQLRLDDESVSRMHALITVEGPLSVTLLNLSGGETAVNGAQVTQQALRTGDRVQLGDLEIKVTIAGQRAERVGKGGRPLARAAALFDEDEVPGAPRSLEVLVLWEGTVIEARHYREGGAFTIGDADKATQFVPNLALVQDPHPLAVYDARGMVINLPEGASGEVMADGAVHTLRALREAGQIRGDALRLPPKARCRLSLGGLTFLISSVSAAAAPAKASPFSLIERQQATFLGVAALLHGLYFALVLSLPAEMDRLEVDRFGIPDRFSEFVLKGLVEQEQRKSSDPLEGLEEEEIATAKAAGEEGKAGRTDAQDQGGKLMIEGPSEAQKVQWRKEANALARRTANEVSTALEGELATVWGQGSQTLGSDVMTAWNNLNGTNHGEGSGIRGMGIDGTGDGGGGFDGGSLGVSYTTRTGISGSHGNKIRGSSRLGPHTIKVPKAFAREPIVMGEALSKEEIRRVVRRKRAQYRYCYEKELKAKRDLAGKITVKFTIGGAGNVIATQILESTMNDAAVEACLKKKIRRWIFPAPKGGGVVSVRYPFIFKSS